MANGNSVNDEIREQHMKMKDKSFKEKLHYFWYYYHNHTIITLVSVIVLGSLIFSIASRKDTAFHAIFVNGFFDGDDAAEAANLCEYLELDTDKYEAVLDFNFILDFQAMDQYTASNFQKFTAVIAAGDLDVVLMNEEIWDQYGVQDYFMDLSEVLPPEMLEKYEDLFVYQDIPSDNKGEYPTAIKVTDAPYLSSKVMYGTRDVYFAVLGNARNIDTSVRFLEYLYEEQ